MLKGGITFFPEACIEISQVWQWFVGSKVNGLSAHKCATRQKPLQRSFLTIAPQLRNINTATNILHEKGACRSDCGRLRLVDQEGIEPSSKRGKKMLSTCLSLPKIQPQHRKEQLNHDLSSKNFIRDARPPQTISDLLHHLVGTLRNNSFRVMSRPDALHQDKVNLLYFN